MNIEFLKTWLGGFMLGILFMAILDIFLLHFSKLIFKQYLKEKEQELDELTA